MAFKNGILTAVGILAAHLALSGVANAQTCEPAKLSEKYPSLVGKTIKIGADPQTPPYVMRDKSNFENVIGIDADLARATFDCAGLKYEFVLGGWSGLLPAVMAGQIDVMWDNLYYKPARAKTVDFVVYMKAGTGALVPAGNPKKVASIEDFCGKTVAFGLGSVEEQATRKQDEACKAAGKDAVTMMPFQDLAAGMRQLESGRSDILLWDLGFADASVKDAPTKYARAFAIISGLTIGAATANGNADLIKVIHDGLTVLQSKGEQAAIFTRYGVDPSTAIPAEVKLD
ncbi:ABC transporter substrate-binding protein [Hansschlegelia quercus]|uniref:ABC transporter substrate-binding protein n=1 Tax=Hansschlegelia quercus TaxID=2528245 RepID=A0A4Q9GLQ7_9HYPH|nr:ABC transporter substrate-binding protein [Hansschlegelia quercus]TBN55218.1 ABC transporter substrate-binding protein [Hansschlegelia quercus]